ncbi:MAG: RNA polymerase sigma factor [Ruminococcaceae bacterium]|nr:RNA polymerase sigma factor [Oscillospiraceae bacterium]
MRYRTMTDAELVRAAASDDCDAFGELVLRWHRIVLAAAYRAVSSDDAEDAVQEAFITAWLKLGSLREPSRFGAWVCRIAVNRAKKCAVHAPDRVSFEEICETLGEDGFGSANTAAEELRMTVRSLPAPLAETLELHYFDGYSVREIADKTGIPEGTVKWRLSEGRNKLRKDYGMNRNNTPNSEIVESVMERIRALRKYFRHDKANFRPEYDKLIAEIEAMPASDERDTLLMLTKFRGYAYDPDLKTPEQLAEIKDIAVRLGDEDALTEVCEEEYRFLDDPEKVTKIRDELLPFADSHGWNILRAALEFDLAQALHDCGEFDDARAYFVRVTETDPADTVRYGIAKGAVRAIDDLRDADHDRCFASFGGYGYERRGNALVSGDYRCFNMYNFDLQFYAACGLFYTYELADRLLHDGSMNPGDSVRAAADDHTLTFVRTNVSVEWDGGTMDGCEEWRMDSAVRNTRTTVFWKRGVGIVREEIERFGEYPERSALVLQESAVTDDGTMLPFVVGNRWVYRIEMYSRPFSGTTEYEVLAVNGNQANFMEFTKIFETGSL